MQTIEVLQAWRGILASRKPSLSIEITNQCPLRCPECYAFDPAHLGGKSEFRQLSDFRGDELVRNILAIVDREKLTTPLSRAAAVTPGSLSGGGTAATATGKARYPHADCDQRISDRTLGWNRLTRLNIVVSIDGIHADSDERRKPATYERILKNIPGMEVTIRSIITGNVAATRLSGGISQGPEQSPRDQ